MITFWKAAAGGLVAVIVMWFAILIVHGVQQNIALVKIARQGGGLGAVAGGVDYLVGMTSTVLLLTAAFGAGFFLTTRLVYYAYIHSMPH